MNRFVFGALAVTTASSLAFAGSESGEAEDWLALDREIDSLASSLNQGPTGFAVSGFLRSHLKFASDIENVGGSTNDLTGFGMDNARVHLDGSVGDYMVHVGFDFANFSEASTASGNPPGGTSIIGNVEGGIATPGNNGGNGYFGEIGEPGTGSLIDAYISTPISNEINFMMGQFRTPFSQSGLYDADRLILPYRTFNGSIWDARDLGIQVNGTYDRFAWWVSAQNGIDGAGDEFHYTARVLATLIGSAGLPTVEGSYGAAQADRLWVAAAYTDDDENPATSEDRSAFLIEGGWNSGDWGVQAEYADYDDGWTATGDSISPLSITANWLFNPDWEAALRWDNVDDDDDTELWTIGVNWYQSGHNAKWQAAYTTTDSDIDSLEYDIFSIGYSVSVGR